MTDVMDAAARRRAKILARGEDRMKLVLGEVHELIKPAAEPIITHAAAPNPVTQSTTVEATHTIEKPVAPVVPVVEPVATPAPVAATPIKAVPVSNASPLQVYSRLARVRRLNKQFSSTSAIWLAVVLTLLSAISVLKLCLVFISISVF
jgi:predicted component of type VI protein secretion system